MKSIHFTAFRRTRARPTLRRLVPVVLLFAACAVLCGCAAPNTPAEYTADELRECVSQITDGINTYVKEHGIIAEIGVFDIGRTGPAGDLSCVEVRVYDLTRAKAKRISALTGTPEMLKFIDLSPISVKGVVTQIAEYPARYGADAELGLYQVTLTILESNPEIGLDCARIICPGNSVPAVGDEITVYAAAEWDASYPPTLRTF